MENPHEVGRGSGNPKTVLSEDQMRRFAEDGYLVVKGVVDEVCLTAVDAEIDALIVEQPPTVESGTNPYFLPPARLQACDDALRRSDALALADQLVAPHHLDHALDHIQVALNLPGWSHIPGGPHIDGHRPNQETPHSFTMLAAIYLTDDSEPASGNLWVWPGSHRWHAAMFRAEGAETLLATSGHSLPPGAPVPVLAERGDLLLAHFLLGHNSGGNESNHVRRIAYYRLAVDGHAARWRETFLDPWTEYAPVRYFRTA